MACRPICQNATSLFSSIGYIDLQVCQVAFSSNPETDTCKHHPCPSPYRNGNIMTVKPGDKVQHVQPPA